MLIRSACVLFSVSATLAQAQELVTNGGFETPVIGSPWVQRVPGEVFGGWTVDTAGGPGGPTQGVVQVGSFGAPAAIEGSQCVELNFNTEGGISQTIATEPNRAYTLSFLMAGQLNAGPDLKTMRVEWDGISLGDAEWSRSASSGQWQPRSYRVTAASTSAVIHFRGLQNIDGGPYIDAVSVTLAGCLADFNADGFLDFFDYDDYVSCFEGVRCPPATGADFNEDGFIDFFDYDGYVAVFEAGC